MKHLFLKSLLVVFVTMLVLSSVCYSYEEPEKFSLYIGKTGKDGAVVINDSKMVRTYNNVNVDVLTRGEYTGTNNEFSTSTQVTIRGMYIESNISTDTAHTYVSDIAKDGKPLQQIISRYEGSIVLQLIPFDPLLGKTQDGDKAPTITVVIKCLIPGYRIKAFCGLNDTYPFPANLPTYTTTGTLINQLLIK